MPRPRKSNRNDGRYEIQRVIGYDINGKALRKSFYGKSKDDALSKYEDYKRRINKSEEEKKHFSSLNGSTVGLRSTKDLTLKTQLLIQRITGPAKITSCRILRER